MLSKTAHLAFFLLIILLIVPTVSGCVVGTTGWSGSGYEFYVEPGPGGGYTQPPTGHPYGVLGCRITWPENFSRIDYRDTIYIYGVIWRSGMAVDAFMWEGPEWTVDGGRIGELYYQYDRFYPEVRIRFPFQASIIGPGEHRVTLVAWDMRAGGYRRTSSSIYLLVD